MGAGRHSVNADGISYLDIGNTVFATGIKAGASISWSRAYAWLLGAALKVVDPSRPHELSVAMAINVAIVAVLLVGFAWWLREMSALVRLRTVDSPPEPLELLVAYGVIAWVVLREVTVPVVTPDMLLAAVAFAATAALVRVARLGGSPLTWLGLGVLLGLGYLVKSAFVAPALTGCVACAVLTRGGAPRRLGALALTVTGALCVSVPFVAVLSSKQGQLEVGGYGTLNYAWDVDHVPRF